MNVLDRDLISFPVDQKYEIMKMTKTLTIVP